MALFQELDGGSHVDVVTGRHSPLPPCSAGQTVVVSRNADRDFFYGQGWDRAGASRLRRAKKSPAGAPRAIFPL